MVAGIVRSANGNTPSEFCKVEKTPFDRASGRDKFTHSQCKLHMTPERRFIVRPQISTSNSSICSASSFNAKPEGPCVAGILDRFTSLCLGSPPAEIAFTSGKSRRHSHEKRESFKKRVVYPVAGFPVHLNSEQLVDQRRKSWYISIVPANAQPGTNTDVDFYSAPVTDACTDLPPLTGWTKSNEGQDPPPKLVFRDKVDKPDPRSGSEPVWNNAGGEDEENHGGRSYV